MMTEDSDIGVVDYGAGNLRNVLNALASVGISARLVAKPEDFAGVGRIVFPGVGAFGDCVEISTSAVCGNLCSNG